MATGDRDTAELTLMSLQQALHGWSACGEAPQQCSVYQGIGNWIASYLMQTHPDLGRSGDVCPYTAQASRLDTIRIGVCDANSSEIERIVRFMRACCMQLQSIPCPPAMQQFRVVVVGFPNMGDQQSLESLKAAQARLRFYTLMRGLMIGRFYETSDDPGLWNPDFRPLRSSIPLLVVRHLVENDAPFVIMRPILVPTYIAKFPLAAPRRLLAMLARRRRNAH